MKIADLTALDLATEPRSSLGDTVPFFFYRYVTLFAIADSMGARATGALEEAGRKAGEQLVKGMFYRTPEDLAEHYRQHGMGLLSVDDLEENRWRATLRECATCHGLPNVDMALCWFDAGLLAGAFQGMFGASLPPGSPPIEVVEEACVGLGDNECVFKIEPMLRVVEGV
jgi:predicted hydrocarbon binding protein